MGNRHFQESKKLKQEPTDPTLIDATKSFAEVRELSPESKRLKKLREILDIMSPRDRTIILTWAHLGYDMDGGPVSPWSIYLAEELCMTSAAIRKQGGRILKRIENELRSEDELRSEGDCHE